MLWQKSSLQTGQNFAGESRAFRCEESSLDVLELAHKIFDEADTLLQRQIHFAKGPLITF
jgi:hypothetical protein